MVKSVVQYPAGGFPVSGRISGVIKTDIQYNKNGYLVSRQTQSTIRQSDILPNPRIRFSHKDVMMLTLCIIYLKNRNALSIIQLYKIENRPIYLPFNLMVFRDWFIIKILKKQKIYY